MDVIEALTRAEKTVTNLKHSLNMRFLPIAVVTERTGRSKASIYRDMKAGTFPRPVHISPSSVRWISDEIDEWMARCVASREDGVE